MNDEEIPYEVDGDQYSFTIPSKNSPQHFRVVATDAAGNEVVAEMKDILVSTNFFVRLYNNTPLFVGTLAGFGAVATGSVSYLTIRRRKKVDMNEDRRAEAFGDK